MYALKDVDAYRTYMFAPLHRKIGEKIAEVHRTRFAGDPELVGLIDGIGSYEGSGTDAEPWPE